MKSLTCGLQLPPSNNISPKGYTGIHSRTIWYDREWIVWHIRELSELWLSFLLLAPPVSDIQLVLATGPGNPPAVWVWTSKTGRFGSRPVQKPNTLTLGGPNPDPSPLARGYRRVWQDPSVPISGCAFRISHLWSHSDMLLLIVKYWHWYFTVHFRPISRHDVHNEHTHGPNHILKMNVNRVSTIVGRPSRLITARCGRYCLYSSFSLLFYAKKLKNT